MKNSEEYLPDWAKEIKENWTTKEFGYATVHRLIDALSSEIRQKNMWKAIAHMPEKRRANLSRVFDKLWEETDEYFESIGCTCRPDSDLLCEACAEEARKVYPLEEQY